MTDRVAGLLLHDERGMAAKERAVTSPGSSRSLCAIGPRLRRLFAATHPRRSPGGLPRRGVGWPREPWLPIAALPLRLSCLPPQDKLTPCGVGDLHVRPRHGVVCAVAQGDGEAVGGLGLNDPAQRVGVVVCKEGRFGRAGGLCRCHEDSKPCLRQDVNKVYEHV